MWAGLLSGRLEEPGAARPLRGLKAARNSKLKRSLADNQLAKSLASRLTQRLRNQVDLAPREGVQARALRTKEQSQSSSPEH
eukprot:5742334-Amphidinium_carterae.1